MDEVQREILEGIEAELEATPDHFLYEVYDRVQDGRLWKLFVRSGEVSSAGLDESLEGSAAWWPGPPKGGADVLSVEPEDEQINLRYATGVPPAAGEKIWIYPPRYLAALKECWEVDSWADRCLGWLGMLKSRNTFSPDQVPSSTQFPWLRRSQSKAFDLLGWKAGFLWGPPGTGKTTSLGAMLANYLVQFPASRVLLFSTTNSAVDLALIAVDRALEQLEKSDSRAETARRECFRIGNHFVAGHYQGREHLIPVKDESLIAVLAQLESRRPEGSDLQAYASWKEAIEAIRTEIRRQAARVLDEARLAALTTTRAVFTLAQLDQRAPYDLIVFDEASQVGIAHALALAPLGEHTLFAGDPKQLAPIVRAEHDSAQTWLGESMFKHIDETHQSTCILTEQSRMSEPICRIVSTVFYFGKLVVALTPFRAQRTLIRMMLRKAGLKQVSVSTVHRAQGSEKHTVIFDPVQGDANFLNTKDAERLINVALSRAQARLLIVMSPADSKNPTLRRISNLLWPQNEPGDGFCVSHYFDKPDFPECAVGKAVQIKGIFGRVVRIESGGKHFILADAKTGLERRFSTVVVKEMFSPSRPKYANPATSGNNATTGLQEKILRLERLEHENQRLKDKQLRSAWETVLLRQGLKADKHLKR